jgi:hypothetical protein
MSYLRSWRTISVPVGLLNVPELTLLGGDVNQDDLIYARDINLVGQAWNSVPADAHWDERADITDDDNVNVLDMVAVEFNLHETAPGPWTGAVQAARPSPRRVASPARTLAAQLVITPSQATLSAIGQTVELDIQVQDVIDLYSAGLQITFDPAVIRVQDSDPRPSAPGVQIRPGDFLDSQYVAENDVDNTVGTIDYLVTQLHPGEAKDGTGVLATIVFEALGEGESTVELAAVELLDDSHPEPAEIPSGTQDGRVVVEGGARIYLPLVVRNAGS